jgi:hypothetical protein
MPAYEIFVHCADCGAEHPLLMKVYLEEGPEDKQSIAESFRERPIPPQLSAVKGRHALCLKTGKKFKVDNDDQILLVPPSRYSRYY